MYLDVLASYCVRGLFSYKIFRCDVINYSVIKHGNCVKMLPDFDLEAVSEFRSDTVFIYFIDLL